MNAFIERVAPAYIDQLKREMREADRREVTRFTLLTPEEALEHSIAASDIALAATFSDGTLAGIFGVRRDNILERTAQLWFLGTDAVKRHPIAFYKASKQIVDMISKSMSDIEEFYNWVDTDHKESYRWIERLGGDFGLNDFVRGPGGGIFRRFYMINPYFKEV